MSFRSCQAERWYVAQTHPCKESFASAHLERQGFRTYLPRVIRSVLHARRICQANRPLFPRYLFVAFDLDVDRWRAIRSTCGVRCLIMDGDQPRAVPRGLVERLAECPDGSGSAAPLAVGGRVRFLTGPFEDRLGRLVEMDDAERVRVLLDILGAEREVVVPASQLLPAHG